MIYSGTMIAVVAGVVALVVAAAIAMRASRGEAGRAARRVVETARVEASARIKAAQLEAATEKRRIETAARCSMHFLTERNQSLLRVGPELVAVLLDNGSAIHGALERVAGVQLQVNDDKDAIRLEGLDGVGREVVRRALHRLIKKPETIDAARKQPEEWAQKARE